MDTKNLILHVKDIERDRWCFLQLLSGMTAFMQKIAALSFFLLNVILQLSTRF